MTRRHAGAGRAQPRPAPAQPGHAARLHGPADHVRVAVRVRLRRRDRDARLDDYIDFLIPGMIVQQIAFGGFATALGLAEDMSKGLIDRFRSLPTARASVLAGRTLADVARTCSRSRSCSRRA